MDECKPLLDGAHQLRSTAWPHRAARADKQGWAVQEDPIKPTLKAPGTKRLKVKCEKLLSIFSFNLSLRRYSKGRRDLFDIIQSTGKRKPGDVSGDSWIGNAKVGRSRFTV